MKRFKAVRKLDALGRIVIPKEFRESIGIGEGDQLEIFFEQKLDVYSLVMQKHDTTKTLEQDIKCMMKKIETGMEDKLNEEQKKNLLESLLEAKTILDMKIKKKN